MEATAYSNAGSIVNVVPTHPLFGSPELNDKAPLHIPGTPNPNVSAEAKTNSHVAESNVAATRSSFCARAAAGGKNLTAPPSALMKAAYTSARSEAWCVPVKAS